jgi:hypothetical protein
LWLTKVGYAALKREDILTEDEENLQQYLLMRVKTSAFRKAKSPKNETSGKAKKPKWATYKETLKLFQNAPEPENIFDYLSEERGLWKTTIEAHLVTLYESWDISLSEILKLTEFSNLKKIKTVITDNFSGKVEALRPIKDILDENWEKSVSYFDIKLAVAMIEKWDL